MPSERAGLSAVETPDLINLHTPLTSRRVRDRVEPEPLQPEAPQHGTESSAAPVATRKEPQRSAGPSVTQGREANAAHYPSLAAGPREHLIPYSIRLPISQIDALDKLCRARNIDKSSLVRDFIAAGLKTLDKDIAALG